MIRSIVQHDVPIKDGTYYVLTDAEAATLAGLRDGSLVAVPKDVVGAAMYLARKHGATNTHTALALAIGFAATDQPA